jgi:hypothetical protein
MVRGNFLFTHQLSYYNAFIFNLLLHTFKLPLYYLFCKFIFSILFPINLYIMEREKLAFKSNFDREKGKFLLKNF